METMNAAVNPCSTTLLVASISGEMNDHQAFLNRVCAPFFIPEYEIESLVQLRRKARLGQLAADQIETIIEATRNQYWAFLPIYDIVIEIVRRYTAYLQTLQSASDGGRDRVVLIERLSKWRRKLDTMLLGCTMRAELIVACDYGLTQPTEPMSFAEKNSDIDMAYEDNDQ